MKNSIASFLVACGLFTAMAEPTFTEKGRTVLVTEKSVVRIRTSVLESTLIVLPAEEKVQAVFGGDKENWTYETTKVASRFVSIKPREPGVSTNLHIISDHGNNYSFSLTEIGSDKSGYDAKIFIEAGDDQLKSSLAKAPSFVPAEDANRYKQEAETARQHEQAEIQRLQAKAQQEAESYRASYTATLHFDYSWDQKSGQKLGVQQIFRDDKFTYIRANSQETPALYEIKDKKPSLVNFTYSNGIYTVPKLIDNGYLAIGKEKMEFIRFGAKS